jgi:hypothetical protein
MQEPLKCKYVEEIYLGTHEGMPCWPNWDNCPTGGWGGQVDSIIIDPEGAYEWCGWQHKNQLGEVDCYETSTPYVKKQNYYRSRRVLKVCDHKYHKWDADCNNGTNQNYVKGNCGINSNCWQNQRSECSNANLSYNSNCKNWCSNNMAHCSTSINNYCNSLPIDTMFSDPICRNIKDTIRKDKCSINGYLFTTNTCKDYCVESDNCKTSIQKYCTAGNFNQYCKDYCSVDDKRLAACSGAIQEYCKGNNIKNDAWCKKYLLSDIFRSETKVRNEIDRFCNNEGSQVQKDETKIDITNLENSDTLENPICACYDQKLIDYKYSKIKDRDTKLLFISRPECLYRNCTAGIDAFKKTVNGPCNIKICKIHLGNANISNSSGLVEFRNDCGDKTESTGISTGTSTGTGTGTSTSTGTGTGTSTSTSTSTYCLLYTSDAADDIL